MEVVCSTLSSFASPSEVWESFSFISDLLCDSEVVVFSASGVKVGSGVAVGSGGGFRSGFYRHCSLWFFGIAVATGSK